MSKSWFCICNALDSNSMMHDADLLPTMGVGYEQQRRCFRRAVKCAVHSSRSQLLAKAIKNIHFIFAHLYLYAFTFTFLIAKEISALANGVANCKQKTDLEHNKSCTFIKYGH